VEQGVAVRGVLARADVEHGVPDPFPRAAGIGDGAFHIRCRVAALWGERLVSSERVPSKEMCDDPDPDVVTDVPDREPGDR